MKSTIKIIAHGDALFPEALQRANPAVSQLFLLSNAWEDILKRPKVAIVGSRRMSAYGKAVTQNLAGELAGQGVVIISGLAYGVDACAHKAALDAGGQTIAVLPGSLQSIYPTRHETLAQHIISSGGALVTEYAENTRMYPSNFIARNRIVAALADIVVVTEASLKSGTLHTARFALEQGIDVMATPGNVTSPLSEGTNNLLRSGAMLATSSKDILEALGLKPLQQKITPKSNDPNQQLLIDILVNGPHDGASLLVRSGLVPQTFNQALTMLEITGHVRALGGNMWSL